MFEPKTSAVPDRLVRVDTVTTRYVKTATRAIVNRRIWSGNRKRVTYGIVVNSVTAMAVKRLAIFNQDISGDDD
jgi:hypothetical protein